MGLDNALAETWNRHRVNALHVLIKPIFPILIPILLLSACVENQTRVPPGPFTLQAGCTTEPTDVSGARSSCISSPPACRPASGNLIAQYTVTRNVSSSGDDPRCDLQFTNYRQTVDSTGISDPQSLCITASISSPGGITNMGQRGKVSCTVTGATYLVPIHH